MSSTQTDETASLTAEGPPAQTPPVEPKVVIPMNQNSAVQPEVLPPGEKIAPAEVNVIKEINQNGSADSTESTEQKLKPLENKKSERDEVEKKEIVKEENNLLNVGNVEAAKTLGVGNVVESQTDISVEVGNTTEGKNELNDAAQKPPGHEPLKGSVANTSKENENSTPEENKRDSEAAPKLVADNQNGPEQQPAPTQNENIYSSESINVQELTDHVMGILNDDSVEDSLTEQQLMKRNVDLQQFIVKLIHLLKEKTDLCANLDRQNSALISQAKSLKDVIAITKDLLGIRNMEIEHLHADMTAMEETIKEERIRNAKSVEHLNEAMTLNDKLKNEYLTQMDLFQKLRDKYNEKVVYLTRENQRLNSLLNPDGLTVEATPDETSIDLSQNESVDK